MRGIQSFVSKKLQNWLFLQMYSLVEELKMITLEQLISLLQNKGLLEKYHIKKAAIFGSILHTNEPNDIDILVSEFRDYQDLIGFREELENATGKHVDLVIEEFADPIILYRARKELKYVA